MERYEANECESYVAGVEIDAFGQQCAEEIINGILSNSKLDNSK